MLQALLVEAFAAGPCQGNGAGVVLLDEPLADRLLQQMARSLNQSETAFLWWDGGIWRLRWFTPSCEVPLCGHGTLAACLALGHWGLLNPGEATNLLSRSGPLAARLEPDRPAATIELPSGEMAPAVCPDQLSLLLQQHLGEAHLAFWRSSLGYGVVLVAPHLQLEAMAPLGANLEDPERQGLIVMQALPGQGAKAPRVMGLTAHYQLRFFAPGLGIDEDPVTGSAHALVAPYWLQISAADQVAGWQCSPRPGGMVCRLGSQGRICLTGLGHVLWDGRLNLEGAAENCVVEGSAIEPPECWLNL